MKQKTNHLGSKFAVHSIWKYDNFGYCACIKELSNRVSEDCNNFERRCTVHVESSGLRCTVSEMDSWKT